MITDEIYPFVLAEKSESILIEKMLNEESLYYVNEVLIWSGCKHFYENSLTTQRK